jgi:malate synthase
VVDALITAAAALHDLNGARRNSPAGSMYRVKPKMHGPDEVALAVRLFGLVEDALGMARNTLKIGIMDEERPHQRQPGACIHAAKDRVVFINTGFLDRTGDEIHTAMEAGPVMRKDAIKAEPWLTDYEKRNVEIGLATGLPGQGADRQGHVGGARHDGQHAGDQGRPPEGRREHPPGCRRRRRRCCTPCTTTRSTCLAAERDGRRRSRRRDGAPAEPAAGEVHWSPADVQQELDNNAQGILGYCGPLDRPGVGCSKVPDIHAWLMEDRATLRISSQHIANWLPPRRLHRGRSPRPWPAWPKVVDGPERRRPALHADGPATSRARPSRPPWSWSSKAAPSQRLHRARADAAAAASGRRSWPPAHDPRHRAARPDGGAHLRAVRRPPSAGPAPDRRLVARAGCGCDWTVDSRFANGRGVLFGGYLSAVLDDLGVSAATRW